MHGDAMVVEFYDTPRMCRIVHVLRTAHRSMVRAVAIADPAHDLAATSIANSVYLWSTQRGAVVGTLPKYGVMPSLALAHDASWVLAGEEGGALRMWPLTKTGPNSIWVDERDARTLVIGDGKYWPQAVGLSPDDRTIVAGFTHGPPRMWHGFAPDEYVALVGHDNGATRVAVGPDWVATADMTARIRLFPVRGSTSSVSGRYAVSRDIDTPSGVCGLAWVPPAYKKLVSVHYDGAVRVWDTRDDFAAAYELGWKRVSRRANS
jgi:WD40 repeat protein